MKTYWLKNMGRPGLTVKENLRPINSKVKKERFKNVYITSMQSRINHTARYRRTGQAMIEMLLLLPLAGACFVLCLLFFHAHTQYLWMDHQLYQGLICLAKGNTHTLCKNQMEQKIKSFLWTGRLKHVRFQQWENKWTGNFTWKTGFWKIRFKKTLNLNKRSLL